MRITLENTDLTSYLVGTVNSSVKNRSNPFLISSSDKVSLSKIGTQLGLQGHVFIRWDKTVTKPGDDMALRLIDNSISSVGKVLEQMRSLSVLAQDESLTDLDRMDLQIDMERLQKKLTKETYRMSLVLSGRSEKEISDMFEEQVFQPDGDMLGRARERIINGEKWDVAEKFEPVMVLKEVHVTTPENQFVVQIEDGKSFELPPDLNPKDTIVSKIHEWIGGGFSVTEDKSVPTVSEKLEMNRSILLMDARSAAKGTERIEKQIDDLLKMRAEFAAFYEKNRDELRQETQNEHVLNDAAVGELLNSIKRNTAAVTGERGDGSNELPRKKTIQTRIGLMEFSDPSDPRLVRPKNKIGSMFARVEAFLKDTIAKNLGFYRSLTGPNASADAKNGLA